jgi:hypothetical protein
MIRLDDLPALRPGFYPGSRIIARTVVYHDYAKIRIIQLLE